MLLRSDKILLWPFNFFWSICEYAPLCIFSFRYLPQLSGMTEYRIMAVCGCFQCLLCQTSRAHQHCFYSDRFEGWAREGKHASWYLLDPSAIQGIVSKSVRREATVETDRDFLFGANLWESDDHTNNERFPLVGTVHSIEINLELVDKMQTRATPAKAWAEAGQHKLIPRRQQTEICLEWVYIGSTQSIWSTFNWFHCYEIVYD